jgi:hypothetical protein
MKIPDREIVRPVQNLASEMREFENPDIWKHPSHPFFEIELGSGVWLKAVTLSY